jgi:tetratricopeptide (TPR) repeat protein
MLRKRLFLLVAALAVVSFSAVSALAQTGQMRGHVLFKQADGTTVPAAGATIDVYRTDVGATYHTKTNKRGEWVFAGLPFVGTYTIAASMPNARPDFLPGAKAGRDVDFEIVLTPGDGRVFTEAEIKTGTNRATSGGGGGGGGGGESAADKAKREELLKKNAEIEASNKKAGEINEVIGRTFKAGNDALKAKNYDEAIKQYREGVAADPEQAAILTNLSVALRARGVDNYNNGVKNKDEALQKSGIQDFKDAADAGTKAVDLIKKQPTPTTPDEITRHTANKYFAMAARAEALRLVATKTDPTQAEVGMTAFQEYIAVETDAAKKKKAELDAAKMLLDAGQGAKALVEYRRILAANPDDPDANFGAGMALFADETDPKTSFQEAANYLQHFVDVAPDTHQFKEEAKGILAELKNTQKVEPVRTPARRGGRRP